MAEQDPRNTDPVAPDADAPEAEAPEAPASRKGKMGLMLILIPALLLPTAGGAWLVMTQYTRVAQAARSITALLGTSSSGEEGEPLTFGQFVQLDGLIINPAGTEGTRYLMVSLGLEADDTDVLDEIADKEVVVRDTVLKTLGARTVQELSDIEMRARLKTEIRDAINALLTEGEIDRLYFTQYVLQ